MELNTNQIKKKNVMIISLIAVVLIVVGSFFTINTVEGITVKKKIELGNKYFQEGKYEEAILAFEKVTELEPKNIEVRLKLADSYINISKKDKAIEVLKVALEIDKTNVDIYIKLGEIYESQKDYAVLIKIYNQGIVECKDKEKVQAKVNELISEIKITDIKSTIEQNDKLSLPEKVKVQLKDTTFELPVKWNAENISTSSVGNTKVEGNVEIINKKISAEVSIVPSRGNLISNIINGGTVAYKNNTIYYSNPKDKGKLYKSDAEGNNPVKLSDLENVSDINLYGEWIYLTKNNDNSGIYKVKADGSEQVKVVEGGSIQIVEHYAYYTTEIEVSEETRTPHYYPQNLHRIDLRDGSEKVLGSTVAYKFIISTDGWLYGNDRYTIFKQSLENLKDRRDIATNLWNTNIVGMSDKDIYFSSIHIEPGDKFSVCKVPIAGSSNYKPFNTPGMESFDVGSLTFYNNSLYEKLGNKLYEFDRGDSYKNIKTLNSSATKENPLASGIYVVGDRLMYFDGEGVMQFIALDDTKNIEESNTKPTQDDSSITEQQIIDIANEGFDLYKKIITAWDRDKPQLIIANSGYQDYYQPIKAPYGSKESIRTLLGKYYTEAYVNHKLSNTKMFLENGNKLYLGIGELGTESFEECSKIISMEKNDGGILVTALYNNNATNETHQKRFMLKNEGGHWKIHEFIYK